MRIVIAVLFVAGCGSRSGNGDVPGGDAAVDGAGGSLVLPPVNAELLHALSVAQVPSVVVDDPANVAATLARRLPGQRSLRIDSVQYEHAL